MLLLLLVGCGSDTKTTTASTEPRAYSGTASVGDFLTITVDPAAKTVSYKNLSNGDTGTVPYTIDSDGIWHFSDSTNNLTTGYEVPDYALLIGATKLGPNHDTLALITAVQRGPISTTTWAGKNFNYMQFRTRSGGIEVGSLNMDAQGNVGLSMYSPNAAYNGEQAFQTDTLPVSALTPDPSGNYLRVDEGGGVSSYVFGAANGTFAVDTRSGAILALQKASGKAFDPTVAGTYRTMLYSKNGAASQLDGSESGTATLGVASVTVTSGAQITVKDANNNVIVQGSLTPVADATNLVGSGKLTDPCYGFFTMRITNSNSQQDVFITFLQRTLLISSFKQPLSVTNPQTYDYFYGVGLK